MFCTYGLFRGEVKAIDTISESLLREKALQINEKLGSFCDFWIGSDLLKNFKSRHDICE